MIETPMIRPFWEDKPMLEDVTVLICQNKTYDLIRLSVESLLTFYPTIKILVVNGSPNDKSGAWLKYKQSQVSNLTVWDRTGYDSHGVAMHEAITKHVTTKYVLTLDSDVIVKRAGWIEKMVESISKLRWPEVSKGHTEFNSFACGALMNVTRSGYAIGPPKNEADTLRYIHPSTGMYDVEIYKSLKKGFVDHGAPCVYSMIEAEKKGLKVVGFPVADYVMHLSGASWTSPRTIWEWDNGVNMRPIVTFVTNSNIKQTDTDYNIVRPHNGGPVNVVIHESDPVAVDSSLFDVRFNVNGDYVCICDVVPEYAVSRLRSIATVNPDVDVITIDSVDFYKRKYFQSVIALK